MENNEDLEKCILGMLFNRMPKGSEIKSIQPAEAQLLYPEKVDPKKLQMDTFDLRSGFQQRMLEGLVGEPERAIIEAAMQVLGEQRAQLALTSEAFMKLLEDESREGTERKLEFLGLAAQCKLFQQPIVVLIELPAPNEYISEMHRLVEEIAREYPMSTLCSSWIMNVAIAHAGIAPTSFSIRALPDEPLACFAERVLIMSDRAVEAVRRMLDSCIEPNTIIGWRQRFLDLQSRRGVLSIS